MKLIHCVLLLFCIALCVSQTDAQWVQVGLADEDIREIACGRSSLFARSKFDREDTLGSDGRLFRSTDGGASWSPRPELYISNVAVAPNGSVYTIRNWSTEWRDSLCRSSDNGSTWTVDSLPNMFRRYSWYCGMAIGPSGNLFVSWWSVYLYGWWSAFSMSTDGGSSWIGRFAIDSVWSEWGFGGAGFAFKGGAVETVGWRGGQSGDAYREGFFSADYGHTWTCVRKDNGDEPGTEGARLAWCSNGNIFLGNGQVWLSADTGATWSHCASFNAAGTALLALPQGCVLAGTDGEGVYLFTDNGDSPGTLNEGLTDLHIHAFALDSSGYVYAGTNAGIWRRPLSQIVSVKEPFTNIPLSFALHQNYPNPFNPSTTIKYELPNSSVVRLSVFDLLGREVSVLVNERRDAGFHEVKFDGSNLASGVYLYRLQAGDFTQTKRLLLLK